MSFAPAFPGQPHLQPHSHSSQHHDPLLSQPHRQISLQVGGVHQALFMIHTRSVPARCFDTHPSQPVACQRPVWCNRTHCSASVVVSLHRASDANFNDASLLTSTCLSILQAPPKSTAGSDAIECKFEFFSESRPSSENSQDTSSTAVTTKPGINGNGNDKFSPSKQLVSPSAKVSTLIILCQSWPHFKCCTSLSQDAAISLVLADSHASPSPPVRSAPHPTERQFTHGFNVS